MTTYTVMCPVIQNYVMGLLVLSGDEGETTTRISTPCTGHKTGGFPSRIIAQQASTHGRIYGVYSRIRGILRADPIANAGKRGK